MYTMKIFFFYFIITLSGAVSFAQQKEVAAKLIKQGMELHDNGAYEAAIKKYDEALQIDNNDFDANYEKSISCLYSGKYDECIALSRFLLEQYPGKPELKGVYINYGSALDDKGESEQAIEIFDQGIKKFPGYFLLGFNKGLTQSRQKKWDDAQESFMQSLKNNPGHTGSLYYMALIQENSNKVAAVLSCLTFLAVEPEGKRAAIILKYLNGMVASLASKRKDRSKVISINAGDPKNKINENDFSKVQAMIGLTASSSLADSLKATTEVEKLSLQVKSLANALSTGKKEGKGLYWNVYAPFFIEMNKLGLVPVFAHIASITSGNLENIQWINDNQDQYKAFNKWLEGYQWEVGK